jgi:hypothetical protein
VNGVVYYYVLAGPAADSVSAARLMNRLVARGHKTTLEARSIRSTPLAFHLADHEDRRSAIAQVEELAEQGVPAYITGLGPPGPGSRYRLYAGAYEGPGDAEVMSRMLKDAGLEAPLVPRTGRVLP